MPSSVRVLGRRGARRPIGTFAEALLAVPPSEADSPAGAPRPVNGSSSGRPRSRPTPPAPGVGRAEANRPTQVAVFHHPEREVLIPLRIRLES
jgi:hypothetical protein